MTERETILSELKNLMAIYDQTMDGYDLVEGIEELIDSWLATPYEACFSCKWYYLNVNKCFHLDDEYEGFSDPEDCWEAKE